MRLRLSLTSLLLRRDWRDDLSAYLDDELTPRERERVERQLAQSDQMREYLADLQDMRSVLRSFAPAPSPVPFQLTPELIERSTLTPFVASGATRALRLSMATAAVGVAAFAAVMVFDVIDSPTVTFTTTQAGDMSSNVPTAEVVTEEVELQSQSAAQSGTPAVSEVASDSEQPGRGDSPAVEAEQAEAEQEAAVAMVAIEEQEEAMEQEAVQAAEQQEVEYEAEEEQAEYESDAEAGQENWQTEQAEQAEQALSAADDPSRRALSAGRKASEDDGSGNAQSVTAADVVAQDEAEPAEAEAEVSQATEEEATVSAPVEEEAVESATDEPVEQERDDGRSSAQVQTEPERRTVASSVRHTESEWPLEERPRSSSVELATDPAWERPVQIVLAAVAVAATTFWLTLTIVDRRRRT